jgi:hypothetical protein
MNLETSLYYTGDKRLTTEQEQFLSRVTQLCAEYHVEMFAMNNGVYFQDSRTSETFYNSSDVNFHGDSVHDYNMMGCVGDDADLTYQLDVVVVDKDVVVKHEHSNTRG